MLISNPFREGEVVTLRSPQHCECVDVHDSFREWWKLIDNILEPNNEAGWGAFEEVST